jgi:hypothetical protein
MKRHGGATACGCTTRAWSCATKIFQRHGKDFARNNQCLLRTAKVDFIKPALASASTLMTNGVLLCAGCQPNYVYNRLNEIKPAMIQEATRNAWIAAEQFSRDTQTSLGKLRNASQGWFQVVNRDAATPERKLVQWWSMWITRLTRRAGCGR